MGFYMIHFTDIHLKDEDNSIKDKMKALKQACCSAIITKDPVFIVISGDIAYSGKKSEYGVASELFKEISDYLVDQKNVDVSFIMIPGNHDCDFNLSTQSRNIILKNINNEIEVDDSIIDELIKPQEYFRNFSESFDCFLEKDIVTQKEMKIGNEKILFLLVNTAWMSQRREEPGKIIIPQQFLKSIETKHYEIVITIMHHPLNWLDPTNSRRFQDFLRNTTDLLLIGHEHTKDSYIVEGEDWSIYRKDGKELQGNDSSDSSFIVYFFNESFSNFNTFEFKWNDKTQIYDRTYDDIKCFNRNPKIVEPSIYPNKNTIKNMSDPGIIINHFSAENIILPEIYVWPEIEELEFNTNNLINNKKNDTVQNMLKENKVSLIVGDSLSGKTSLGKMMFLDYIEKGKCCILLKGEDITSFMENKVNKVIEDFFCKQYTEEKLEKFRQLPKEKKVIIIDNFDSLKFHDEKKIKILDFLMDNFDNIIILCETEISIPIMFSSLDGSNNSVKAYRLLYMGNKKRKELIRKWYYLRESDTYNDKNEHKVDNMTDLVNNFLGKEKRFIPAVPVFIINVLQNSDSFSPTTFVGSQYGFLYESLIHKSLSTISKKYKDPGAINIDINILSKLAFKILENSQTYFTYEDLYKLVKEFELDKKLTVSSDSILEKMLKAKIVYEDTPNCYKYKYPYIFYYFSGRYIAYNMDLPEVKESIEYMSSKLYNEQYGNIIIFVCHFAKSIEIIETILLNAYTTLENYEIFDFDKDKDVFIEAQTLIDKMLVQENVGDSDDVKINKEKSLSNMDDAGIQDGNVNEIDDTISDDIDDKERDLASITAAMKTMEVLGQILQNYPGDIDGKVKIDIIDEVYRLGMRIINALVTTMGLVEKDLISMLIDKVKEDESNNTQEEIINKTRSLLSMILASMVRGMINKTAVSMSSEYLLPALIESFKEEDSISEKLILQEIKFNCLRSPDINQSLKLFDEIKDMNNPFALSILRSIVAYYLKYNKSDYKIRTRLCNKYGFKSEKLFIENIKVTNR